MHPKLPSAVADILALPEEERGSLHRVHMLLDGDETSFGYVEMRVGEMLLNGSPGLTLSVHDLAIHPGNEPRKKLVSWLLQVKNGIKFHPEIKIFFLGFPLDHSLSVHLCDEGFTANRYEDRPLYYSHYALNYARPDTHYVKSVCKIGKGSDTCRYLALDARGWSCEKHSSLKEQIDARRETMSAKSDNCFGFLTA